MTAPERLEPRLPALFTELAAARGFPELAGRLAPPAAAVR